MVTYERQSPADIRIGDMVVDALGRTFIAQTDAALDHGDYVLDGILSGETVKRSFILDSDSLVSISYNESDWEDDY